MRKTSGAVTVRDRLVGKGVHTLRWHFHLAPGVTAHRADEDSVLLASGSDCIRLRLPADLQVELTAAEYSPSYGVKLPCLAIDASVRASIEGERSWVFEIESA
jgi:hypothetical protein